MGVVEHISIPHRPHRMMYLYVVPSAAFRRGTMPSPRTSIIMPVYNTANTVVRAIDSVLSQTDPDFELIIINDQSPDDSHRVIQEYLQKLQDPRISYHLNEKNLGLAGARNVGISHATGEWLAYLDSDDAYKPNFLEVMHAAATDDVDVVGCAHDIYYPDGSTQYRLMGEVGTFSGDDALARVLSSRIAPFAWDKIFRRAPLKDIQFPLFNRVEDAGYSIAACTVARALKVIPDSLNLYSVNPESITWGSTPPFEDLVAFMDYVDATVGFPHVSRKVQSALAISRIINFVNSGNSVLRQNPSGGQEFLRQCRQEITPRTLYLAISSGSVFGIAGALFKYLPAIYYPIYRAYIKRTYGM